MSVIAAAFTIALTAQSPEYEIHTFERLGLSFRKPVEWRVEQGRVQTTFTVPTQGDDVATIQVFESLYRQTPEQWQEMQLEINDQLGREVEEQWRETLLGVPLLLTRLSYNEAGTSLKTLVGLLYSATDLKLNYRLTAKESDFDFASDEWKEALLTLRTADGALPGTESPDRPFGVAEEENEEEEPVPNAFRWELPEPGANREIGPVRESISVGESTFVLTMPENWRVEMRGEERVLVHPDLTRPLSLRFGGGDQQAAVSALSRTAGQKLSDYETVELREDSAGDFSKSGAWVKSIRRSGTDAEGERVGVDAVGWYDGRFWQVGIVYPSVEEYQDDKRLLEQLFAYLRAENESAATSEAPPAAPPAEDGTAPPR
jgi:hypothetical protein